MIKTNIRESYALYKENVKNPVSLEDYVYITGEYNKFLMEVVFAGHKVSLPHRMGTLEVQGKECKVRIGDNGEIKGLAPDWKKTKKLWEENPEAKAKKKLVYITNAHTGNIRYKFVWSKRNMIGTHKWLYTMTMTRTNKRELAKLIKQGKEY